jgi:hypothetical protein
MGINAHYQATVVVNRRKEPELPFRWEAGWDPGPVWGFWRREKSHCHMAYAADKALLNNMLLSQRMIYVLRQTINAYRTENTNVLVCYAVYNNKYRWCQKCIHILRKENTVLKL